MRTDALVGLACTALPRVYMFDTEAADCATGKVSKRRPVPREQVACADTVYCTVYCTDS